MRNPFVCGSLAQHSGVFVLMFLCVLMVMPTSHFQTTNVVGGSTTETKKITVQPIPKQKASERNNATREFHCEWPMARASDILAKLLLVRREDADAAPSARNGHITDWSISAVRRSRCFFQFFADICSTSSRISSFGDFWPFVSSFGITFCKARRKSSRPGWK